MPIDPTLFHEAADKIDRAESVAIISHHRPDGDAIGSTLALRDVLTQRGKRVAAFLLDSLPHGFLNFTLMSGECRQASKICVKRIRQLLGMDMPAETEATP